MPCYHCGKGAVFGRSHTHRRGVAGGRWKKRAPKTKRVFRPNLQPVRIIEEGDKIRRVKVCTKCLKRVKKDLREGKKPFFQLAYLKVVESRDNKVNGNKLKTRQKTVN